MRICALIDLPKLLDFYQLVINETEDIDLNELNYGSIICYCELTDCILMTDLP